LVHDHSHQLRSSAPSNGGSGGTGGNAGAIFGNGGNGGNALGSARPIDMSALVDF
jgi:hypothetical protein